MFNSLAHTFRRFDQGRYPALTHGITRRHLLALLAVALRQMQGDHGITIVVSLVPQSERARWHLGRLWRLLGDNLSAECVAILGLEGRHYHWTVATSITNRQITLTDSDGLRVLKRRYCTVAASTHRVSIKPSMVIFVTRERA